MDVPMALEFSDDDHVHHFFFCCFVTSIRADLFHCMYAHMMSRGRTTDVHGERQESEHQATRTHTVTLEL